MEFGIFDHVDRSDEPLADRFLPPEASRTLRPRRILLLSRRRASFDAAVGRVVAERLSVRGGERTRRLRFGPLVYLLPFYHPLRLIEEVCFLDQISRGRMQLGVGRGISPFELRYFGVDPDASRQRFDEIFGIFSRV